MSSLTRARSLRKPTSSAPSLPPKERQQGPARNVSPSRLPVKPSASAATAPSSSSAATSAPKVRPTSTILKPSKPTTSVPLRRSTSLKQKPTTQEAPPKKEQSRYPPSTTVTRAHAPARPTSAGSTSSSLSRRTPSTHVRANSAATAPTAQSQPKSRSRPPSREQAAPAVRTPHRRVVSVEKPKSSMPAPATPSAFQPHQRLRPMFNTLQQHYSPAKTQSPKPLTGAYLAPPSPSKLPANVVVSAETSRLQAELLQLHLLHRDAGVIDCQWHASAKEKLGERFRKVGEASRDLVQLEAADVGRENAAAIRKWGAQRGPGLEDKIQALDAAVSGVWAMSEPGGRYARLVRRFERWADGVCELEEARRDGGEALLNGRHDSPFIGDLDGSWSDECAGMARKLEGWQAQLDEIGDVPETDGEPSSLERILVGSRGLVEDMLAELAAMEEIREAALAREDAWIDRVNREDDEDDTPRAGAVWRVI